MLLTLQEVARRSVTKTQVEVENGDGTEEEMTQKVTTLKPSSVQNQPQANVGAVWSWTCFCLYCCLHLPQNNKDYVSGGGPVFNWTIIKSAFTLRSILKH